MTCYFKCLFASGHLILRNIYAAPYGSRDSLCIRENKIIVLIILCYYHSIFLKRNPKFLLVQVYGLVEQHDYLSGKRLLHKWNRKLPLLSLLSLLRFCTRTQTISHKRQGTKRKTDKSTHYWFLFHTNISSS